MKLSLCLDPGRPWSEARAMARQVDEAGWHAVYQCDHFMPHDVDGLPRAGDVSECWTTLSALAAITTRVRLGSLVLGNTYRHPAVVAGMAATLDRISEGRVVLGIGAGWQPNEHAAFGIPLPEPAERIDALDEACTVLRMLLDDGHCTFSGATYQLRDAICEPRPVQDRLSLLVGGGGERRTMKVAARHADVWHCWADPRPSPRRMRCWTTTASPWAATLHQCRGRRAGRSRSRGVAAPEAWTSTTTSSAPSVRSSTDCWSSAPRAPTSSS